MRIPTFFKKTWALYYDGFRGMTVGRKLWVIIILKLIIFFAILKVFFFPDILSSRYDNDEERAGAVREALTTHNPNL